jgi:hypothetical protein
MRSWAGMLMAAGHLAFAILFAMNLLRFGKQRSGPTLFLDRPDAADLTVIRDAAGRTS